MKVKLRPASSRSQVSPSNLPARTPVLRTSYVGAAIKAMFHPRLFQICLWTFVNPFRINQVIEVTQRTSMIRLAWSALAFFSGLILAFAFWNMPLTIKLVLLPAISTLLLLLTSIDLKDSLSPGIYPTLLLLVLIIFRMLNPIVIIRSFKHSFDTENCYQQNDCADSALDFQNLQFTGGDFPRSYPG